MTAQFEAKIVRLSESKHIAAGKQQFVYEHPDDPTSLIKIFKPHKCDAVGQKPYKPDRNGVGKPRFRNKFRRATAYKGFLREFREYLEVKASCQTTDPLLPISEIKGLVATDLGLGMVHERISGADGTLSPTLASLARSGQLHQYHRMAIDEFFERMIALHITAGDLNPHNIVYQSGDEGSGRAVCVDGFSKKQKIPYLRFLKRLNTRELVRMKGELIVKLDAISEGYMKKNM